MHENWPPVGKSIRAPPRPVFPFMEGEKVLNNDISNTI